MPTKRTRRINPRKSVMDRTGQADWFMTQGTDTFNAFNDDLESMEDYWEAYGDAITREHVAKHPGERPWGWFAWERPEEPRPVINPMWPDSEALIRKEHSFHGEFIAKVSILHGHVYHDGEWTTRESYELRPWLEDETDYLERLGFLSDDELQALELPDDDDNLAGDDQPGPAITTESTDRQPTE